VIGQIIQAQDISTDERLRTPRILQNWLTDPNTESTGSELRALCWQK